MAQEAQYTEQEFHRKMGVDLFNMVWDLMDKADFDIAFAYEAVARANAVAGNAADCQKYLDLAKKAGKDIKKEGDKQYFFDDLGTISCEEQ
jgi:hypothetical protein